MAERQRLGPHSRCGMHHTVLLCPKDRTCLTFRSDGALSCEYGHRYAVIDGVPGLLRGDIIGLGSRINLTSKGNPRSFDGRDADLYLESLDISEQAEKDMVVELARTGGRKMDAIVSVVVAANTASTTAIAARSAAFASFGGNCLIQINESNQRPSHL